MVLLAFPFGCYDQVVTRIDARQLKPGTTWLGLATYIVARARGSQEEMCLIVLCSAVGASFQACIDLSRNSRDAKEMFARVQAVLAAR